MTTSPRESYPHSPDHSAQDFTRPGDLGSPYNREGYYTTAALNAAVARSGTASGYAKGLLDTVSAHNPDHVVEPTLGN
jgi:hypothetical protein